MNLDRTAPEAADTGRLQTLENGISRRDTLALAAAGMTAFNRSEPLPWSIWSWMSARRPSPSLIRLFWSYAK
jgi:hypothetical protein